MVNELREQFIQSEEDFVEGAVQLFESQIEIETSTIRTATLTITALGLYEAELNGHKVGDQLFTPGFTYYPRHLYAQQYELIDLLKNGMNTFRVYLAQGWYCGRFGYENNVQIYGDKPAVSWIIDIVYLNGKTKRYSASDFNRVKLISSPYRYAGFYDGEVVDFSSKIERRRDQTLKRYKDKLPDVIELQDCMVKRQDEMPVILVSQDGECSILDFGQNFAGFVEIDLKLLQAGEVIKLRHGEILNPDGSLYTRNLRKAKAEISLTISSDMSEFYPDLKYRPRFTYMGFRYIELSGTAYQPGLIKAFALHNEMERRGFFSCENEMVERLYLNQLWGQKSNYVEIPTDCPQRDERMGYTGDGHVFALTGSFNYDVEAFWAKFMKDIRYSQLDNKEGYVAPKIPASGVEGIGFMSMLGWGNAVTIIPELLYWQYGNDEHLERQYESMKTFVLCEMRQMNENGLWLQPSLGDWLMPGKDLAWMAQHHAPVSNALLINDLRIISWVANRLGHHDDSMLFSQQLKLSTKGYIHSFILENGEIDGDYQGAYVIALQFVPLEEKIKKKLFSKLLDHIKRDGLQTGFFSTQHLLPLLAEAGEAKMAYDLLLNESYPGWMYQIKRGATTNWERWDAIREDGTVNEIEHSGDNMVSFNHYAFGSVGQFFYQEILGIKALKAGYKRIRITPFIDARLGSVSGSYKTAHGSIDVSWLVDNERVLIDFTSPVDCEFGLGCSDTFELLEPGTYHYEFHINETKELKI